MSPKASASEVAKNENKLPVAISLLSLSPLRTVSGGPVCRWGLWPGLWSRVPESSLSCPSHDLGKWACFLNRVVDMRSPPGPPGRAAVGHRCGCGPSSWLTEGGQQGCPGAPWNALAFTVTWQVPHVTSGLTPHASGHLSVSAALTLPVPKGSTLLFSGLLELPLPWASLPG